MLQGSCVTVEFVATIFQVAVDAADTNARRARTYANEITILRASVSEWRSPQPVVVASPRTDRRS